MKKGFFPKLAAENIKKNSKTYTPYVIACIMTVAMFYMVKSLSLNPGLGRMAGGNFMNTTMALGSRVVAVFAFLFLFYTNSFLAKQRKKEFGVFNVLGLEKRHLARVVGWETLYTALFGLFLGLGIGLILDKAMFLAVNRLVGGEIPLGFLVSGEAIEMTVALFLVLFVLIFANSVRQIYGADPVELLRAGNVGEKEPKANWILTVLGLGALGSGYYIAITTVDPIASVFLFFIAVILVIVGTYLLFTAGSIAFLKTLRRNKKYYYKTRHFVSVSGMLYRMKQNAVGLANICVLSTMVLVMVSTTTCLMTGMEESLRNRYPADFVFYFDGREEEEKAVMEVIHRLQEQSGWKVTAEWDYTCLAFQAVREAEGYQVLRERARSVEDDTHSLFFITLSDYNAILGENRTLADGEILVYSNRQEMELDKIRLLGREYRVAGRLDAFVGNGEYESLISATQYIVVPDMETIQEIYEGQKEILTDLASEIEWIYGFDMDAGEEEQKLFGDSLTEQLGTEKNFKLETRADGREAFLEIYGGMFFIGIFLGVLFVMATALIIYYKQISEGYDDKNRFEIMQKVGMSRSEVKVAIHSQVLLVFFLPLAVAGIHTIAAFPLIFRLLALLNLYDVRLFALCTVGCFLVFGVMYVLIYTLTAKTYYRIVSS